MYLRNILTQNHVERFMFVVMEKYILTSEDTEDIIEIEVTKSLKLKKIYFNFFKY